MNQSTERWQLRDYTVKPGEMADWIAEWRENIVGLRRSFGFDVIGAWKEEDSDRFVWIVRYRGERSFEEADAAYYASPERKAIHPDPARHIAHSETRFVDPVKL